MNTVVTLRVPSHGLADAMMLMREWLDQHRLQAASFAYDRDGDDMVVQIGFAATDQADAFATHFATTSTLDRAAA